MITITYGKAKRPIPGWLLLYTAISRQNWIALFWCTVPLKYVYKWLITQAMANWVTINIVLNDCLIVESILSLVDGQLQPE